MSARPDDLFDPFSLFYGAMTPNWLMEREELSQGAKLCYARLVQFAGRNAIAFPSQKSLAKALGTKVRQVQRYLIELEEVGLLWVQQVGLGNSNRYGFRKNTWIKRALQDPSYTSCQETGSDTCDALDTPHMTPPTTVRRESIEENHKDSAGAASVTSKTPRRAVGKKNSDLPSTPSAHVQFRDHFMAAWQDKYKIEYPWGARCGKAAKELLIYTKQDVDAAIEIAERFLRDSDKFLVNQRHALFLLGNNIAKHASGSEQEESTEPRAPTDEELDILASLFPHGTSPGKEAA